MHIVIFTGGESPLPEDARTYFENMPEPDLVIAADSGLDSAELYRKHFAGWRDFSPDRIIGDMDSLSDRSLLEKYADAGTEILSRDKDFTDTELALQLAKSICGERKRDLITLIGGNGGRADHFIGIYETFSSEAHADLWLCGNQVICCVEDGDLLKVSGLKADDYISVSRTASSFTGGIMESEGLKWGSEVMRKSGMPSISNRISEEFYESGKPVVFKPKGGTFLVFVPLRAVIDLIRA